MKARPSRCLRALSQATTSATTASASGTSAIPLRLSTTTAIDPAGKRQQGHRQPAAQQLAGADADLAVGLQGQEGQRVDQAEGDHAESAEHGVHVEPGEGAADAVAVGIQRQARGGQRQHGADAEGGDERAQADGPVPEVPRRTGVCPCRGTRRRRRGRSARSAPAPAGCRGRRTARRTSSGKAAKVAPPAVSSQTSLPSQTGPMVFSSTRRCLSFLAKVFMSMPTPRSNPSRKR